MPSLSIHQSLDTTTALKIPTASVDSKALSTFTIPRNYFPVIKTIGDMSELVHLQILIKKVDSMTNEEFHQYWEHEHPKAWLSVKIVQSNIVKYTQFHIDNATSDGLRAHGLPIAVYDGGVNMWARSMEELMAVFQDEEYLRIVVPDEEKFLKRNEATMMLGKDIDLWVDGKKVETT